MSPFQDRHQPTHAGQPAGALDFAPDEEPIASSLDGEGPPFDLTFLDPWMDQPTGLWGSEFASQNAIDLGLNEHGMMPSLDAGEEPFDWTSNNWADETLGFSTEFASQSALGPELNGQVMIPPFDSNPWTDQPTGPLDAQVASQGALLALRQAPIAPEDAPSYLQDASLNSFDPSDWKDDGDGMPDALGGFAYPISLTFPDAGLGHVLINDGMATLLEHPLRSPRRIEFLNAAEGSQQNGHAAKAASATPYLLPTEGGQGGSPSIPHARENSRARRFECDYEGCTHKGRFPRKWELTRHINAKHVGSGSFVCLAEGCFNKKQPWAFTRSDKLTAHIKSNHGRDKIFTACPIDGCDFGESNLETLGVHLKRAHKGREEGRGVLNASIPKMRKCPLWRCGKYFKAAELLGHVAGHDADEVLAASLSLQSNGIVANPAFGSALLDHSRRGLTVGVMCPICNTISIDFDEFASHLWASHLFLDQSDGVAHFVAWRSACAGNVCMERVLSCMTRADVNGILPWCVLNQLPRYKPKVTTIRCPWCQKLLSDLNSLSENQSATMETVATHHLSLLRPKAEIVAELKPHRMEILRLYPEFVSHPVFADFDQPKDRTSSSSQE